VILTVGRWLATERYKGMDTLITALPRLLNTLAGTATRARWEKAMTGLGSKICRSKTA